MERKQIGRPKTSPERLLGFSDGVFAVLITILVLELHPPAEASFRALLILWPQWLSYGVSYLFVAIVWLNHHYLMRHAAETTHSLQWFNFAHLFAISLLPFSTAWMAVTRLAPDAVAFYAAVFFLVNATYLCLIWELIDRHPGATRKTVRNALYLRSFATLCLFASAILIALWYPLAGLGICICCLAVYLRPEAPLQTD